LVIMLDSGKVGRGDVIVLEEVGVAANKREWYKKQNSALSQILQTFRSMGVIIIFNCPLSSFMDGASHSLLHTQFITDKILRDKQECHLTTYMLEYNEDIRKTYSKFLRVGTVQYYNRLEKLKIIKIPIPPTIIRNQYEKKKTAFQKKLYKDIIAMFDDDEIKNKPKIKWECLNCDRVWKPNSETPVQCTKCRSTKIRKVTK